MSNTGYVKTKLPHNPEFERWLREMNFSMRDACKHLDIPHQRIMDMRAGNKGNGLGALFPSVITRLAMSAMRAGIEPVLRSEDCYEIKDRLASAAVLANLSPWPLGTAPDRGARSKRSAAKMSKAVAAIAALGSRPPDSN